MNAFTSALKRWVKKLASSLNKANTPSTNSFARQSINPREKSQPETNKFNKQDLKIFNDFQTFCLIIGNARSGSTILGSAIDAHPNAIVANETLASNNFWRGLNKESILQEVIENACVNHQNSRPSENYHYQIGDAPATKKRVHVYGDKIWNPATLLLHGDYELIPRLSETLNAKIFLIASIRNPFDTIATMHRRSQAPIADRIRWYFMHCESISALEARSPDAGFMHCHHELLIANPDEELLRICEALNLSTDKKHLESISKFLFKTPSRTSSTIDWTVEDIENILTRMQNFPYLAHYQNQTP